MCTYLGPLNPEYPGSDPFTWLAVLKGPIASPYESGVFRLRLTIPEDYPQKAPLCEFMTKVYHPNISETGEVCLDILREPALWNEQLSLQQVVISVLSLLCDANPHDPLCHDIARQFIRDRRRFESVAADWTARYAK